MVKAKHDLVALEKCLTGIRGLDEITYGGLPKGRPTLICGGAGSGKTVFAMEFLMHGAIKYGEPGVFMTFEETPQDLAKNFSSLGFNLPEMISRGLIETDHVRSRAAKSRRRENTTWKDYSSASALPLMPSAPSGWS